MTTAMVVKELPEEFSSDDEGHALATVMCNDSGADRSSQLDQVPPTMVAGPAVAQRTQKHHQQPAEEEPAIPLARVWAGGGHFEGPASSPGTIQGASTGVAGADGGRLCLSQPVLQQQKDSATGPQQGKSPDQGISIQSAAIWP